MSDIKARYVGSSEGVSLTVPVDAEGEPDRHVFVPHGGELPTEVDGFNVPASFRDSLLEQKDNWTQVKRKASAKADEKEDEG
jgi:hypothetical protein